MQFSIRRLATFAVLLGALSTAGGACAQVLNLSKDLVAMGIATSNMTPNTPSLDSSPLLQAGVAYASAHSIPSVVAERGSYYFLSLNSPSEHVYLNATTNVTVDLRHSDLYFAQGNIKAIDAANTVNLTLENFTVDYLQLPFTQLTVTSVDTSAKTISFTQLGSYSLPSTFNALTVPSGYINDGYFAYVFRNGQELSTTGRMKVTAPFNDTSLQLAGTEPWAQAAALGTILPGDTLVLEWRAGVGAVFASGSTGLTVKNVSVYASGFIGVFTNLGSATTIDHVQVIPRPGTDRLISSNADGIHLAKAGANNAITNNTVKRTCDDAIAMDGQWYAIVAADSSTASVQVTRNNNGSLAIGAAVDFIDIVDATIAGTATIVDENPEPAMQTGKAGEPITLTLDHAISGLLTNFGVTPNDPNLRGSGTVISGNLAQEIVFGRGIYPAGVANVTITDNMIEATNRTGIIVEQDEGLTYNYKTGPSSGITVQSNIVDNALGYGNPSAGVVTDGGGIAVVAEDQHFAWVATQSLTDIAITDNFVTNTIRSGIRMENVNSGTMAGNTVLNYGTAPDNAIWFVPVCAVCETMAEVEADFTQPVLGVNSVAITEILNTTSGTPVENQSSADGSYRLAPNAIAVARGQKLSTSTAVASGTPLPHKLAGVEVKVKDSAGVSRLAGLYSVSPSEITYVIPEGTAPGVATVTIGAQTGGAFVSSAAPALFSADATGSGVALATALLTTHGGTQTSEAVYQCTSTCTAVPLDLGVPSDTLTVSFQGTGIRHHGALAHVTAEVGGVVAPVETAAKLPGADPGIDYVVVKIPHSLAGAGEVPVVLTVDGFTANVVTIDIK
jgi:uncharacterized protein (TIGR03437 family)